jgi:hypothetical protein
MGPLPPPLASLERNYLVLRARVESGEISVADAVSALAGEFVYDSNGARWRVDPSASPAHKAVFLTTPPGGLEHPAEPHHFPAGPPKNPALVATPTQAADIPVPQQPNTPVSAPAAPSILRTPLGKYILLAVAAVVSLAFLRGCVQPDPAQVSDPPPSLPGLQPLPEG